MDIYPCPPLRFSVTSIGSRLTKLDSDYNIRQVIFIACFTVHTSALVFRACTRRGTWPSGARGTSTTSPGTTCPASTSLLWSLMLWSEHVLSDFLAGALEWLATSGGLGWYCKFVCLMVSVARLDQLVCFPFSENTGADSFRSSWSSSPREKRRQQQSSSAR